MLLVMEMVTTCIFATEYYVALNGSDSNSGSIGQPWASFTKVADNVAPGDTVYVRAGTYTPAHGLNFYKSGTAAAPITFKAYPGEAVILDGSHTSSMTMLVDIECNYFVIQDFELRNSTWNGVSNYGASNTVIRNCKIHDSQYGGIYAGKGDLTTTHDVLVENCTIYNNCHMNDAHTLSGGWPGALTVGGANNVTLKNNVVYQNQGEGIIFYLASNCRASGNIAHDNYGPNMYIDNARFCTLERNLLYCTGNATYYRNGNAAPAFQIANEVYNISNPCSDVAIINNVLIGNNFGFYYSKWGQGGGLKNFTFANNTMYLAKVAMFHIDADAHGGTTFCNNISCQSGPGTQTELPSSLSGLSFSHNLWYGGNPGAAWMAGDLNSDPKFVNPGSLNPADYQPPVSSPAHAAGTTVASVASDFNGTARTQSMDVGAFVCGSGASSTPPVTPAPPVTTPPVTPPPVPISAPHFDSAPSYSPHPAVAGQTVTLAAAAASGNNAPLAYTWDMGDGSTLAGASVAKVYSTAGSYTVTVTASDGNATAAASLTITVSAPGSAPATPAGGSLSISRMTMVLNLARSSSDALSISGSVAIPQGFAPSGAKAMISIGDFQHQVTLNSKGSSPDRTFKLSARMSRGTYSANSAKFVLSIKNAPLSAALKGLGLASADGFYSQDVNVSLTVGANTSTGTATAQYLIAGAGK
jgi:parallel beta-helix repeat protein